MWLDLTNSVKTLSNISAFILLTVCQSHVSWLQYTKKDHSSLHSTSKTWIPTNVYTHTSLLSLSQDKFNLPHAAGCIIIFLRLVNWFNRTSSDCAASHLHWHHPTKQWLWICRWIVTFVYGNWFECLSVLPICSGATKFSPSWGIGTRPERCWRRDDFLGSWEWRWHDFNSLDRNDNRSATGMCENCVNRWGKM